LKDVCLFFNEDFKRIRNGFERNSAIYQTRGYELYIHVITNIRKNSFLKFRKAERNRYSASEERPNRTRRLSSDDGDKAPKAAAREQDKLPAVTPHDCTRDDLSESFFVPQKRILFSRIRRFFFHVSPGTAVLYYPLPEVKQKKKPTPPLSVNISFGRVRTSYRRANRSHDNRRLTKKHKTHCRNNYITVFVYIF